MSLENMTGGNQVSEPINLARFPVTGWRRVWHGLFVTVLPSFSFWAIQFLEPEWQSGDLPAYLALLLQPAASIFFLFLLAYSVISYLLLLIHSERYASLFP
ncbi:MAG TPA: hypothetical protein VJ022_05815, partial [Anaerolineales bacterium]|nr:hypothetical protein [Anaerolineales bacterium]